MIKKVFLKFFQNEVYKSNIKDFLIIEAYNKELYKKEY